MAVKLKRNDDKQSFTLTRKDALLLRAVLADRVEEWRFVLDSHPDSAGIEERIDEYVEIIAKLNAFGL